ncbi:HNH endonuclease family protein [Bacillus tropicus]|uniref:hypothetical protein n=1 Tax=Bacillus tropicus TaxID=2026188 RepID=UPI0011A1E2EB|nr:hypothetical protein [Bacillus tropicus]
MIKVERCSEVPTSLIKEQSEKGMLTKAINQYTAYFEYIDRLGSGVEIPVGSEEIEIPNLYNEKTRKRGSYNFKKYKESDVKEKLNDLFHGKCAYCESKYKYVHPMEVEHFRPKAGVKQEREDKRNLSGYYWLAWDWNNLFPSCIKCNRESKQKTHERGKVLTGKGNLFPLEDDLNRATRHYHSIESEIPLILNPCLDNPEDHIEFTNNGVIRPVLIDGDESIKGKTSINVYALDRIDLTIEREEVAILIKEQIERVKSLMEKIIDYPNDPRFGEDLEIEIKKLNSYMQPDKKYSQMAKQIIKRFEAGMDL